MTAEPSLGECPYAQRAGTLADVAPEPISVSGLTQVWTQVCELAQDSVPSNYKNYEAFGIGIRFSLFFVVSGSIPFLLQSCSYVVIAVFYQN